jgi:hypothetical protein
VGQAHAACVGAGDLPYDELACPGDAAVTSMQVFVLLGDRRTPRGAGRWLKRHMHKRVLQQIVLPGDRIGREALG